MRKLLLASAALACGWTGAGGGLVAPAMVVAAALFGGGTSATAESIGGAEIVVNEVKGNLAAGKTVAVLKEVGDASIVGVLPLHTLLSYAHHLNLKKRQEIPEPLSLR